jgi:uncharacterized protein (TIGR00251 family)
VITLELHAEGVTIPVKALPGAKRNECRGETDGALRLCVTAAPEKGKANKALSELLAKLLDVKKSQVELLSGETNPKKVFLVRNVSIEAIAVRIDQLLSTAD